MMRLVKAATLSLFVAYLVGLGFAPAALMCGVGLIARGASVRIMAK
jgi:hypothetical protein